MSANGSVKETLTRGELWKTRRTGDSVNDLDVIKNGQYKELEKLSRILHASCKCCTLDERDAVIDALRPLVEQGWQIDLTLFISPRQGMSRWALALMSSISPRSKPGESHDASGPPGRAGRPAADRGRIDAERAGHIELARSAEFDAAGFGALAAVIGASTDEMALKRWRSRRAP
jgi:hypothetical protein